MSDDGPGTREVAHRLFAAEFDDASLSYSESDEERAPNYVVTPTGARVNRLFVAGVLTEVERVNDRTSRGRVVDPSGAFVTYAGQYQPDEQAFLERVETPAFVALTGKARTFEPEDSDRVFTSVRPESVSEVDADTRDRWVVSAAEATLDRLAVLERALDSDLRGEELRGALEAGGAPASLSAGIPKAIAHYDTSPAYLEAVRRLAVDALELIAGERDDVRAPDIAPDAGGDATVGSLPETDVRIDPAASVGASEPTSDAVESSVESVEPTIDPSEATDESAEASDESSESTAAPIQGTDDSSEPTSDSRDGSGVTVTGDPEPDESPSDGATTTEPLDDETAEAADDLAGATDATDDLAGATNATDDLAGTTDATDDIGGSDGLGDPDGPDGVDDEPGLGDFDAGGIDDEPTDSGSIDDEPTDSGSIDDEVPGSAASEATDEMYELDEAEREEIESEFGTDFATGSEVDEPGEADIDVPGPDEVAEGVEAGTTDDPEPEATSGTDVAGDDTAGANDDGGDGSDAAPDPGDVDLEAAAVEEMEALDDGDGADREAVVEAVASEHGVEPEAVEEAIQEALMGGKCYEPGDGLLKAI